MTEAVVEKLYRVFARYPLPPRIEGCPCCVGPEREGALHRVPLRALREAELGFYAFKALSTFGTVADFKHFLPRIAELLTQGEPLGAADVGVIATKLARAGCTTWPDDERDALRGWSALLWRYFTEGRCFLEPHGVLDLGVVLGADVDPWIDGWPDARSEQALCALVREVEGFARGDRASSKLQSSEPWRAPLHRLLTTDPRVRGALARYAEMDPLRGEQALALLVSAP